MSKNMHFPLRKHKKTCFNSFAAVSTAPMPSYGAFCAEFHALHKEHSKPHAAREKHAKKAHTKWRAARATQHTTQTPYQIPLKCFPELKSYLSEMVDFEIGNAWECKRMEINAFSSSKMMHTWPNEALKRISN